MKVSELLQTIQIISEKSNLFFQDLAAKIPIIIEVVERASNGGATNEELDKAKESLGVVLSGLESASTQFSLVNPYIPSDNPTEPVLVELPPNVDVEIPVESSESSDGIREVPSLDFIVP